MVPPQVDREPTFRQRQPIPYTPTPYSPPQMTRDSLKPQLAQLGIRSDNSLPFSRGEGEDGGFPNRNGVG